MGIVKSIKTLIFGRTLYFPGCVTKYKLPEIQKNYESILKELNIEIVKLNKEFCCGLPALNKGYTQDFERLRHENMQLFKKHNIKHIITNCPACAKMFKEQYAIHAQHITEVIPEQQPIENRGQISYHKPCHQPNDVKPLIKSIGFEPIECNRNCCGTGHIDDSTPLSQKIAEQTLQEAPTKKIVTTCPLCYKHLKESAEETEILELSQVIME